MAYVLCTPTTSTADLFRLSLTYTCLMAAVFLLWCYSATGAFLDCQVLFDSNGLTFLWIQPLSDLLLCIPILHL